MSWLWGKSSEPEPEPAEAADEEDHHLNEDDVDGELPPEDDDDLAAGGGGGGGGAAAAEDGDPFNAEEKAIFDRLRARLEDMRGDPVAADFLSDDSVMWRYYTAHADGECPGPEDKVESFLDAAEEMFRGSVAWRNELKIDEMWERWLTQSEAAKKDPWVQLGRLAFYGQNGVSLNAVSVTGGPITYERLGKVDAKGILKDEEVRAAVTEAYIMSLESAWRCVRGYGGKTRATMVLDLKGLGWSFFSNMDFIKQIAKIGPPNYPEISEKILAVRAPWILKAIWSMISPLLPKRTREKVGRLVGW